MSSNQYPKPPKFSPAKTLMGQTIEPKAPVEEAKEPETKAEPGSLFSTIPTVPTATTTSSDVEEVVVASDESLEAVEEDAVSSEVDEVDEATGQVEDEPVKYYEGGPWEIIKHTGYVNVSLWALFTAAISGGAAYFFTPSNGAPWTWIALGVLGFMTGVIAAVDKKTHLIKNQHTILTAILTVPLATVAAFHLSTWNVLLGLLSAALVFGVFIFLVYKVNFGSGGDIKFSPVPAFALGVINPLISALWLFYALILTVVLLVVRRKKSTSFGEGMALSLPLAIMSVYALYAAAGLPYMESASL